MKLPTQIRYGVRALFYIAFHKGGGFTQVKEIAQGENISPRYLEQIFQRFKKAGLVGSLRGPHGGYYLLKKPADITAGDIVKAINDSHSYLNFCINPKSRKLCERKSICPVRDVWKEASEVLMRYLNSVTLEDLCKRARKMGIKRDIEEKLIYEI